MYQAKTWSSEVLFSDRQEAGQALATSLIKRGSRFSVVLGLTRGGVPVAFEVAQAMGIPMDILVVKKLRAPISEELAIGAVCSDGTRVLHPDVIQQLQVSESYVERETHLRLAEAQQAERLFRGDHSALDLTGASVVIVDDGIATGASMEAAVISARHRGARSVTVAVPVGSREACMELRRVADDVFCMTRPVEFWAVGQFYMRFEQVPDDEVRRLLHLSRTERTKVGRPDR